MALQVHFPSLENEELEHYLRETLSERVDLLPRDAEDPSLARVLIEGTPSAEQLDGLPQLESVLIPWAGLARGAREALRARPQLAVFNLHHNAAPVAEHAVALLLATARSLIPADRALRAADWQARYAPSSDPLLEGMEALVVGAGAVGRRIARALEGLDMKSRLMGRTAREGVHGVDELDELLPRCGALLLALPLTEESEQLFDRRRLALLPPGALLVNVGRAKLVEEAALFEAVKQGRLRAGLDVWYHYPKTEEERADTRPPRCHSANSMDSS